MIFSWQNKWSFLHVRAGTKPRFKRSAFCFQHNRALADWISTLFLATLRVLFETLSHLLLNSNDSHFGRHLNGRFLVKISLSLYLQLLVNWIFFLSFHLVDYFWHNLSLSLLDLTKILWRLILKMIRSHYLLFQVIMAQKAGSCQYCLVSFAEIDSVK